LLEWLSDPIFWRDVFAIALGILIYDYVFDPFIEGTWKSLKKKYKRRKKSFIERQGIATPPKTEIKQ